MKFDGSASINHFDVEAILGQRIQQNILAKPERWLLNRMCATAPAWITPERMTLLGLSGAVTVLAGDCLSNLRPSFLFLAIAGYFLHWLGDSLDGSLATFRGTPSPRFGYFIDHSVDALGNTLIMLGLGATTYIRMDVALFTLSGYLLMSIFVFLKNQVLNTFQLSFLAAGPTELRVLLIGLTLVMFEFGRIDVPFADRSLSLYDLLVGFVGFILCALFVWNVAATARKLRDADGQSGLPQDAPEGP